MYDKEHQKDLNVKFKYMEINMDKYKNFWYSKDELEIKKNPLLVSFDLSKEEMKEFNEYTDNNEAKKVGEKVERLNSDKRFVYDLTAEEEAKIYFNTQLDDAEKKGMDKGIKKGKKEGVKEGIKEKATEIVKNMLNDNVDINTISKYTGLSLKDIKALQTIKD